MKYVSDENGCDWYCLTDGFVRFMEILESAVQFIIVIFILKGPLSIVQAVVVTLSNTQSK